MSSPEYTTAINAIYAVKSPEELGNILHLTREHLRHCARATFRYGQRVQFVARDGRVITGVIDAINPKTISVQTPAGKWRVGPSLLSAAA